MVAHKTVFSAVNTKSAVMGRVLCGILLSYRETKPCNHINSVQGKEHLRRDKYICSY